MKIVIIGGVAAGLTAATKLKRGNPDLEVIVYERGRDISYGSCGLPYFIADDIKDSEKLIAKDVARLKEEYDIDVYTYHEVIGLKVESQEITVKDLKKETVFDTHFDKLIIATGASPIVPPLEGVDNDNVFTLRDVQDGIKLKAAILKPSTERIVIIGGGYIGLEIAEAVKKLGKQIRIIEKAPRILSNFDEPVSKFVATLFNENGVKIHINEGLEKIVKNEVITEKGRYHADVVIMSVGSRPNTEFLKDSGIERLKNGAIVVNDRLETSIDNIYAAGDCASTLHLLKSKPDYIGLASIASKEAKTLARILLGEAVTFQPILGSSAIKIFNFEFGKTGLGEEEARAEGIDFGIQEITINDKPTYYPGYQDIHLRILYEKTSRKIIGGQVYGVEGAVLRTDVVAACIFKGMTADEMAYLDLCYAPPFSNVWDAINTVTSIIK